VHFAASPRAVAVPGDARPRRGGSAERARAGHHRRRMIPPVSTSLLDMDRTVRVRALFFASYRELAGTDEIAVDVPAGSSVADLVERLRGWGNGWEVLPSEPAVAVNRTYAPLSTALVEGDEVAFIPPVSGG